MGSALETLCGQAVGAGQFSMLGIYLQRSCIISMVATMLLLPVYIFTTPILKLLHQSDAISDLSGKYARWVIPQIFAFAVNFPLQKFFQSQSRVWVMTFISRVALAIHILLNWILVTKRGHDLFGAALAGNISWWLLNVKESNVKAPEPQKDYIHVRARRGQATDSHSLAERVRREKISERMKLLQDLVPSCNKVTGKALMLDEIINYVQSLQKQVEFLSMKLATVNPRLDFNVDSLIPKDMHQSSGSLPQSVNSLEASAAGFQYTHQPLESQFLMNALEPALHRTLGMQLQSLEGFGEAASQLESFWENDLHNVVHMGFGQGQETVFASQGFHDQLPTDHMKIEL